MKAINLLLIYLVTFLTGCNFESGSEDDAGGGLFSGHKEVTNTLSISLPTNQIYTENENLDFVVSHPFNLTVTGNPRLELDIDGDSVYANLLSGSGTKNLTFRYIIQAGEEDTGGIQLTDTIDLNGGTIQFSFNGLLVDSTTEISDILSTEEIKVDTVAPSAIIATPPSAKTYYEGNSLEFYLVFDDMTYVTGAPTFQFDIGGSTANAIYVGGSGTTTHIYKYSVSATDVDLDGIEMISPISLNGGTITDQAGNHANITFPLIPMPTTFIDGDSPYVTSFDLPADKTYTYGEIIYFDINFNEIVTVAGGTPTVPLTIGVDSKNASYISGSGSDTLKFQYIISNGDEDTDGMTISTPLTLNGATIQDSGNNDARLDLAAPLTPYVKVDGSVPEVIALTAPTDLNYTDGMDLDFVVQFSEDVIVSNTPRVEITIDTGTVYADYLSGTNTDTLTFRYTVQNTDQDDNGISLVATALDLNTSGTIISAQYNTINALLDYSSYIPADMTNILVNENPADSLAITVQPVGTYANFTMNPDITVEVRDSSNLLVPDATEAITLSFGTDPSAGAATISGTLTVNAINGVATFNDISIDTINSGYTFIASSGTLTTDTSSTFDITQAPATQVVFKTEPINSIAGANISPSIEVEIQDSIGNIIPTANDNVTLAFNADPSAGDAILGGTLTVAAASGVATFNNINIDKAFTGYSLDATSGVLTSATSTTFNISPNIKSKLAFNLEPVNADYGENITPAMTVEIQDAFGNVTTDSDTITLAINNNPGASTLSGNTTIAATSGTASFSDISLDQLGVGYTLDATSGALTLVTSAAFDIVATPTQLAVTNEPVDTNNDFIITPAITVEIRDANGNLVVDATDSVTVAIGTDPSVGVGTLSGTLTVAAEAGIATFNDLSIDNVQNGYDLSFTSGVLTAATSASFNITQAPATQLAITQEPSDAVAGIANAPSIVIELRDANNNLVSNETSNVTIALGTDPSAGTATLGGTLTVAAINGVATFNDITLDKAFTGYTLAVTSGALTGATSAAFNISPAAKSILSMSTEPTDTLEDETINPAIVVEIHDAFGNKTADTDNIVLSINNNPGAATLGGTLTQAAINGTATFNDIDLDTVGVGYTLDATATGLVTTTTATFDILSVATQLAITTQPTNTIVGDNINPSITVEIRDNLNALVSDATDAVTLSFGTDPSGGSAVLSGTLTVNAVAGVATFNDISIDLAYNGFTLMASSGSLTTDTSSAFNTSELPTVSITSISDLDYINSSENSATYALSGTCNLNGQTVVIEVDSTAATSPIGFICDGSIFSGTIDTTGLSEAAHTFIAKMTDTLANVGTSSILNITKDITAPEVQSITPPINNYYIATQNLDFTVNLDEITEFTGIPRVQLDVDSAVKYAIANSGSGSSAIIFRYTVQAGEEDSNGIGFQSSLIDLNAGSFSDAAGNTTNLNLDAVAVLPNLSSIFIDGVLPTVTIDIPGAITSANQNNYSISGTCSESGESVPVSIGGISITPACLGGGWTSGSVNVSGLADDPSISILADHSDAAGNNAVQAAITTSKETTTPLVTITFSEDITSANETGYSVSGTCTENGETVTINIGSLTFQPICSGGNWTTGFVDVSSLVDNASISLTADHSTATQASTTISKDTTSPIVTITSSPNISISNQTNYIASGSCSENGTMVDINIGVLNYQPNCSDGSWTTGVVDVSSLSDSISISFTADHSTAVQATTSIEKNTLSPTVDSLSVATTLADSANINWNLNDPGGFTIDDYEINYRTKGASSWLTFSDGVSTNTSTVVDSLLADTTYEFRVRLIYNTSSQSTWSNTAEGTTKPDELIFDSPYKAMNVGGATDTNVVVYYDNTTVTLNGVDVAGSPFSKGAVINIPGGTNQFDIIDADKPIYTAGRRGSGGNSAKLNVTWNPVTWAGKDFTFNAYRSNSQNLSVYAIEDATIEVKQGSTLLDTVTLTAGGNSVLSWDQTGSLQVTATGTILAYHVSVAGGSSLVDGKPLLPSSTEVIGFPSTRAYLTSLLDATNFNGLFSDSTTWNGVLSKANVLENNGNTGLYAGASLLISADKNIAASSFADNNGSCAAPFLPTNLMKKNYAINSDSDWVAFASKQSGTIDIIDVAGAVVNTLTLTQSGGNTNAPFKAYTNVAAETAEGLRYVSTVPVAAWYQPDNDTGSSTDDETILYGTDE